MTMNFNRNGGSGTSDYSQLSNKPQINGVTLSGNKTSADLKLMPEYEVDDTPTELSENLITSGAVWNKLQGSKQASNRGGTITISDYGMTESITMYFNPSQDLHGYSKPWAGGAGKNKLPMTVAGIKASNNSGVWNDNVYTINNGTFEILVDSGNNVVGIKINGTFSSETTFAISYFTAKAGSVYKMNGTPIDGTIDTIRLAYSGYGYVESAGSDKDIDRTNESEDWHTACSIIVANNYTANNIVYNPMIRLATETDPTFEPYSNICPIVGQSEATFSWTDSQDIETTRTMNFGNTYYGGVCHFDGTIYPDWDYIASYNGETLTGEWISDRDEYTAGTTPTNGAEVAYKTTPTQVRVTPPANLNLTDDYPIEYNGYMANIVYQPKDTVLEEAKNYTNQEIAKLVPQVYSTSEEKVGAWIDGKPIYQITIDCGLLLNSMAKTIDTQIVVDKIIKIDGVASTSTNSINLPHVGTGSGDGHVALSLNKDANNKLSISITSNSDRTSYTGYVTVQYTKLSN